MKDEREYHKTDINETGINETVDINKVKTALLAMQRHSWEQGVAMQAFWEAGDYQVAAALAKEAVYRSLPDGRTATIGVTDAVTDPCATGEVLLWCAENLEDEEIKAGSRRLLSWALTGAPKNKEGVLYHLMDKKEFWIDSMYMLPPYLMAAGFPREALKNAEGYWRALYDEKAQLLCHMWDDEKQVFIRSEHWGVGNGWALAGMARLIGLLPRTAMPETEKANARRELIKKEKLLIESILSYRRTDGLFHDVIDKKETFVETNLSQMLAYTIYSGIYHGWLPEAYGKEADICRRAAEKKVDSLGFVQGVCGAPTFDKPGMAPEGNAFFILMEHMKECAKKAQG